PGRIGFANIPAGIALAGSALGTACSGASALAFAAAGADGRGFPASLTAAQPTHSTTAAAAILASVERRARPAASSIRNEAIQAQEAARSDRIRGSGGCSSAITV